MSLNDEPCMVTLTLIYLNPGDVKYYYPFMVSLDKYSGSWNYGNDLSTKIFVPSKTENINVKAFNIITNRNEVKTLVKHISCDCKCKFNNTTCHSNQNWNNKTCQYEYKNYHTWKKDYSWNPSKCTCENGKYLKSNVDDSKIVYNEIIYAIDIVSTKMTNTIPKNMSINYHNKKVTYKIDFYISRVEMKKLLGRGATNYEILSVTMFGQQRKFFISNRLKRLEKLNICRTQAM